MARAAAWAQEGGEARRRLKGEGGDARSRSVVLNCTFGGFLSPCFLYRGSSVVWNNASSLQRQCGGIIRSGRSLRELRNLSRLVRAAVR